MVSCDHVDLILKYKIYPSPLVCACVCVFLQAVYSLLLFDPHLVYGDIKFSLPFFIKFIVMTCLRSLCGEIFQVLQSYKKKQISPGELMSVSVL
ncbi:hypothetical protein HanRHA438_Chr08g0344621 [Helianthus annuus]|nr:hypothetical protein HanRHA438_Chr08g0344621 [Helianthus annuus]